MIALTAFIVAVIALAHLFSNKLLFLQGIPRSGTWRRAASLCARGSLY